MYLRHTIRKKDGKVHRYWTLVRRIRVGRRVIQQTVAQLGELDERGRTEARALARRLIGAPEEASLFNDDSQQLTAPVRLKGVRVERSRQFGEVYLALALWRGVGLEELCKRLLPAGQERVAWAKMAAVLVTARLCEPSSELHIAEDWYRRTALCDLLRLGEEEVNKDRLYRALDRLLAHKAALEAHLSERCGELFAVQNDVMLYDVTSTYFEGQAEANPQAQRGYSRDHRPDCWRSVREGVEVKLVRHPETDETVILCRSADRRSKEQAMHDKFSRRIEQALERLSARLARSKKPLDAARVNRQIGRILQQNQRAAARLAIVLEADGCAAGFRLRIDHDASFDDWAALSEGAYLLRSNISDWSDQQLWKAYIRLCVQRRLACSAGERPAGARIRGPVVWIAGWRETKTLKPIDNVSRGEATSHRAVTTVNAKVASKVSSPEGRAPTGGRRRHGEPKSDRCGSNTSAGWKRQHGDKDMPSNWRSPPRPEEKSSEQGRSYNRLNREVDRRREGDGWVRSSVEAG